MVTITAFEVPVADDERFVDAWKRARRDATLYRALRPDVEFRFVSVASEPDAVRVPFAAQSARYEVVHDDGAGLGADGVTLINPFEVAPGDDESFVAGWRQARDVLAAQRGYLGTRLHRAVGAAAFRFVNVARWSSPLAFSKAVAAPAVHEATAAMRFASHPALYTVVAG